MSEGTVRIYPPAAGPMPSICEGMTPEQIWEYGHLCGWRAAQVDPAEQRRLIYQAVGAASMCWSPRPGSQVFETERAIAVGEALYKSLQELKNG